MVLILTIAISALLSACGPAWYAWKYTQPSKDAPKLYEKKK